MEIQNERPRKAIESEGNQEDPEESEAQSNDYKCGVFSWRPQCLQKFVRPMYFTLVYLLYGIFQVCSISTRNHAASCLDNRVRWLLFSSYLEFDLYSQGAMKTGLNSSMTTIERKFGMSGKMISVVMIMDNITGTLASLIVGYYATKVGFASEYSSSGWNSSMGLANL